MQEQKDTFQYVPLHKGLQVLFKNKEISDEVCLHLLILLDLVQVHIHKYIIHRCKGLHLYIGVPLLA